MPRTVLIKRVKPGAIVPRYQTEGAAGADVHACLPGPIAIPAFARQRVPLGLAMELPPDLCASLRGRSGLSSKGIVCLPGLIDADYRGEVSVTLQNLTDIPYVVQPGDRIAQLVIEPCIRGAFVEQGKLSDTARGENGHGSTGISLSGSSNSNVLRDSHGGMKFPGDDGAIPWLRGYDGPPDEEQGP